MTENDKTKPDWARLVAAGADMHAAYSRFTKAVMVVAEELGNLFPDPFDLDHWEDEGGATEPEPEPKQAPAPKGTHWDAEGLLVCNECGYPHAVLGSNSGWSHNPRTCYAPWEQA